MKKVLVFCMTCACIVFSVQAQPNFEQVGFSTQNGGTTGGEGGQTVTVDNYADLKSYAESADRYIIMVEGTITNGSGGGVINVNSNTSIIGVGSSAFLSGISLNISSKSNIILQNFKQSLVGTSNPKSINDGDCIGISGSSRNIWIDHLELYSENPDTQTDIDKYDGLIDIKQQSGWITISWCYLHDHHKGGLVGAGDSDLYVDRKITLHHNHYNKVKLRVPMYRGATGHFFNNYIKDAKKASEIRAGTCVRIEKNYYDNFSEFAIYTTSDSPGKTERIDNYLSKSQSRSFPSSCTADIPYDYSAVLTNNVQDVKTVVQQYAGVGKLEADKDCNGDPNGTAYLDDCNVCVGGNTGKSACVLDCNGDVNGTASIDECGVCTGGNTGKSACLGALQGEDFCEAIGVFEDKNVGFAGTGYINFDNQTGSNGKWFLHAESSGNKTLGIRYANGGSNARSMSVTVNGNQQANFQANPTATWTDWQTENVTLNLTAGANEIVLTATTAEGGPNVDAFTFESTGLQAGGCETDCNGVLGGAAFMDNCNECVGGNTGKEACTQDCEGNWGGTAYLDDCSICIGSEITTPCSGSIEAETACDLDGTVDNNNLGFSGEGFANTTNAVGSYATWVINSTEAQTATLKFRYANGGTSSRDGSVSVNGAAVTNLILPSTGDWETWKTATIQLDLVQGNNEIIVTASAADGLANLDLIAFYSEGLSDAQCGLITAISDSEINNLLAYPNPVTSHIQLSKKVKWTLLNAEGKVLESGEGTQINMGSRPNGLYILQSENQVIKIIKN